MAVGLSTKSFLAQYLECGCAPLMGSCPVRRWSPPGRVVETWARGSERHRPPARPAAAGPGPATRPAPAAGMSGHMRSTWKVRRLVPAAEHPVFTRGGKPSSWSVRNGIVHLVPVRVPVNDGRIAKVSVIAHVANARTGTQETLHNSPVPKRSSPAGRASYRRPSGPHDAGGLVTAVRCRKRKRRARASSRRQEASFSNTAPPARGATFRREVARLAYASGSVVRLVGPGARFCQFATALRPDEHPDAPD